jgi:putative DNA primase/helicase
MLPFDPKYRSTHRIPYDYDLQATCPRYREWLASSMDADDQRLWIMWSGMVLSGCNTEQKIMLLLGIGGSGKGQQFNVLRGVVGDENVFEFKSKNLGLRFEMNKLIDKTLLVGTDVAPNFLTEAAAHHLKGLTGDDAISAELKNVNGSVNITGNFNVGITANTKLRIRLEQDYEAWSRRLLVIRFENQVPADRRVPHFAQSILKSEASGIINLMLDGLRSIRAQRIVLTDAQKARVDELLGESDSMRRFMEDEVQLSPDGDLTTDDLVRAHDRYCQERGWIAPSKAIVEKEMHKLMLDMYNVTARNDVLRGGTARRGFGGFALKPEPYKGDQM